MFLRYILCAAAAYLLYIGIIGLILLWLFRLILDSAKRGKGKDND